ncbi:DUF5347 family protein [Providencia rettgeri]|uniref:DUF5347 family protein n=1 Tax=Providencia rettgeri TaxID=587 RepID=UPI001F0468DE|nr:DUF5347 family protein [Providencia rettgeri]MCG9941593.1 DUF5347 domain-containing protein [Providencia rettgeri]
MQQNPAILEQRYMPMSIGQRVYGINKTCEVKSKTLGLENKELKSFFKEMRDRFNEDHKNNKKLLAIIFIMAEIDKSRRDCQFEDFTSKEIFKIVKAVNYLKGSCPLLPKNLTLPLN